MSENTPWLSVCRANCRGYMGIYIGIIIIGYLQGLYRDTYISADLGGRVGWFQ